MRRLLATSALITAFGLASAAPAGANLCVTPGHVSPQHGAAAIAGPDLSPADFADRGQSLGTPFNAAWSAHIHSPVVDGPTCELPESPGAAR